MKVSRSRGSTVSLSTLLIAPELLGREMHALLYMHRISDFFHKSQLSAICLVDTVENQEKCKRSKDIKGTREEREQGRTTRRDLIVCSSLNYPHSFTSQGQLHRFISPVKLGLICVTRPRLVKRCTHLGCSLVKLQRVIVLFMKQTTNKKRTAGYRQPECL